MSYSKRQLVEAALGELGLSDFAWDIMADQLDRAIRRLDAMIATWNAQGIRLGYPLPGSPDKSDGSEDTGLPDSAWEAVITNLAIRIAPSFGKAASPETRATARNSFGVLIKAAAMPPELAMPAMLAGAGAKDTSAPFTAEDEDLLATGAGDSLEYN